MHAARYLAMAFSAICLFAASTAAGPGTITETVPEARGEVNWSNGVLRATGVGVRPQDAVSPAHARLLARRAAIADAYRNLAVVISGVRVTANTTVERYITASDTVRVNVEAYIRDAQITGEQDGADGVYTVTMQVGMNGKGALTGIVLPTVIASGSGATELKPQPAPPIGAPAPVQSQVLTLESDLLTAADARGPFTGLIIDTRGLDVQPAMSPRVLSPSGKEVYGTLRVDPEVVEEKGIAGYMGTIRAGMGIERVGDRPLVIRALGTPDEFRRYVTISEADAQRVLSENGVAHFLEKSAVILVVDERRARDEAK